MKKKHHFNNSTTSRYHKTRLTSALGKLFAKQPFVAQSLMTCIKQCTKQGLIQKIKSHLKKGICYHHRMNQTG